MPSNKGTLSRVAKASSSASHTAPRPGSSPRQARPSPLSPRSRPLKNTSPRSGAPLKASASALQPNDSARTQQSSSSTSSDRQRSERKDKAADRLATLEAEVAVLREQLQQQADAHQADLSLLRSEQALRRAALEDGLRAEAAEAERALCSHFAEEVHIAHRSTTTCYPPHLDSTCSPALDCVNRSSIQRPSSSKRACTPRAGGSASGACSDGGADRVGIRDSRHPPRDTGLALAAQSVQWRDCCMRPAMRWKDASWRGTLGTAGCGPCEYPVSSACEGPRHAQKDTDRD